ncbi:MAG: sigma-54 dependent transcriptional regulator [Candidatus Krumholzibacteriia bacterium]
MSVVLIVDDVAAMREQYAYDVNRLGGHRTLAADGGAAALDVLAREPVDCMILDLEMPNMDGFQVLAELKRTGAAVPVIVYTGTGNYDRCVRAIKLGAYTFIDKDEPVERVVREIDNALAWARLRREVRRLRRETGHDSPLVGESRAMAELRERIERLAAIPSPVLVTGDSGSGKELVARQLHDRSPRAAGPFVAVNCAALPDTLFESELFGHVRGAFTGADRTRRGAFENAGGGTLFLDEVGELPLPAQAKLLRVLEDGRVQRVGSTEPVAVDTRVVAATNRDLSAAAESGRFRTDLLFRLDVHRLRVPPLRERLSDVPALVEHFLALTCERFGIRPRRLAPVTAARLAAHDWRRNNVRELRNVVERLVIATDDEVIGPEHVPPEVGAAAATGPVAVPAAAGAAGPAGAAGTPAPPPGDLGPGPLRELKAAAERRIVLAALERNDWHITRTAAELGLADHSSLLKIMRRHGLRR